MKAFHSETELDKLIHNATPGRLTEKEYAYRYLSLAGKDFLQGFEMLRCSLKCFQRHVKNLTIYHHLFGVLKND